MDFNRLAAPEVVSKTVAALTTKGVHAFVVSNGTAALEKIKQLIPSGASVMNGSSVTLEQIGFVDYLKQNQHGWNNMHQPVVAETDPIMKKRLRLQATLSDYYLGSVHAITEDGDCIIASNTGSQLPHIAYTSKHVIFVVSTKKIVPTLTDAFTRLENHVVPLEDTHSMEKFGSHTLLSKILIFKQEKETSGREFIIILVEEDLGF